MAAQEYRVTLTSGEVTRDFLFRGGPIDDFSRASALFEALGLAASSWARLEQHLDAVLIHINQEHVAELYNPEHPVSFTGKIRLLKKWFNGHPELAALAADMRQLTSGLKKLSPQRNTYLHSILEAWNPEIQIATFHSIKSEGNDDFRISKVDVPLASIRSFAVLVDVSNKYLSVISEVLFTPGALERFRRP